MKNIKSYAQVLTESKDDGQLVHVAFAGDSNIYAVGFYASDEQAEKALEDRYTGYDDDGFRKDVEDPHVFTLDPKDPKGLRELLELAIDAEGVIGPGGVDGEDAHLSDPAETMARLIKSLVSIGVRLEDIIGFEHKHKKGLVLTLGVLFDSGLFDEGLDWMPEGPMKAKIMRMKKGKSAFGM